MSIPLNFKYLALHGRLSLQFPQRIYQCSGGSMITFRYAFRNDKSFNIRELDVISVMAEKSGIVVANRTVSHRVF